MARRRKTQPTDLREVPMYHLAEAAYYVNVPETTLSQWFYGRKFRGSDGRVRWSEPLIEPADIKRGLLSFANLAEAHVLQATRDRHIPMDNVRSALRYVRERSHDRHPLISQEFYTHQKDLFIKRLAEIINASKGGQIAFDLLDPYLDRLVRDSSGLPFRLFPMRANPERNVMCDLHIASGQPVLTDTGILAQVVFDRNKAGESSEELAADYGVSQRAVEHAIQYIADAAA